MSVSASAYAVGASIPVQIAPTSIKRVIVQNLGGYYVYVGPSNVTASTGFCISPAETAGFELAASLATLETLYAIADTAAGEATSDVRVLAYTGI